MGMSDTFGLISMNPQDSFMREKIVREVNSILNECYKKAKELLEENRKLIEALVEELLYKEEMNLEDFETIYNKINILE